MDARRSAAWGLVAGQLALLAGMLLCPGPRQWSVDGWAAAAAAAMIVSAGAIGLAGAARLGRGLSASPLPNPATTLRTSGVYRWVRHPIYSALLLGGIGIVIIGGRLSRAGLWLVLLVLLLGKIRWEERELTRRFPDYAQYARRTPRLVPNPLRYTHLR